MLGCLRGRFCAPVSWVGQRQIRKPPQHQFPNFVFCKRNVVAPTYHLVGA